MEKDIYIRLIEYGIKNSKGFCYKDIIGELEPNQIEREVIEKYLESAFDNTAKTAGGYPNLETLFLCIKKQISYNNDDSKYVINYEAHFKYIDYLELKEAREFSKKSFKTAITAIVISAITFTTSIYFSTKQINAPTTIDFDQFNQIKELIKSDTIANEEKIFLPIENLEDIK